MRPLRFIGSFGNGRNRFVVGVLVLPSESLQFPCRKLSGSGKYGATLHGAPRAADGLVQSGLRAPGWSPAAARVRRCVRIWSITAAYVAPRVRRRDANRRVHYPARGNRPHSRPSAPRAGVGARAAAIPAWCAATAGAPTRLSVPRGFTDRPAAARHPPAIGVGDRWAARESRRRTAGPSMPGDAVAAPAPRPSPAMPTPANAGTRPRPSAPNTALPMVAYSGRGD